VGVPNRWKLIVLDWDGTIMDSTAAIVRAAERAIEDTGLPRLRQDTIRGIIGLGLRECWDSLFPGHGGDGFEAFVDSYREHFVNRERLGIRPYPGVEALIESLHDRGVMLAVATGKSRRGLDRDFDETGLGRFFRYSVTSDEARSKPHPEMLLRVMEGTGVTAGQTLMVGDTEFDLQMARSARVDSVAVAWGAHDRCRLEASGPLACLETLTDLAAWLENFETELDEGLG